MTCPTHCPWSPHPDDAAWVVCEVCTIERPLPVGGAA